MKITKVIYFDEGSVTDYMQIINNGDLKRFTELVKGTQTEGGGDIHASGKASSDGSAITKLFKTLTGADYEVGINADGAVRKRRDRLVKNILENTILTDFLEAVGDGDNITILKGYNVYPLPNSFSYLKLAAPYFSIMREDTPLRIDENFTINISEIENVLREGRGYYEFIGESEEGNKIIIRFNSNAFRNNYTMSDIIKMKLIYYAVKVGSITLDRLSVDKEFEFGTTNIEQRVSIVDSCIKEEVDEDEVLYEVYDVLLAGVGIYE